MIENLRNIIYNQHDVICNQKYGDNLPYSFHLRCVEAQAIKFMHLIPDETVVNTNNIHSSRVIFENIILANW